MKLLIRGKTKQKTNHKKQKQTRQFKKEEKNQGEKILPIGSESGICREDQMKMTPFLANPISILLSL